MDDVHGRFWEQVLGPERTDLGNVEVGEWVYLEQQFPSGMVHKCYKIVESKTVNDEGNPVITFRDPRPPFDKPPTEVRITIIGPMR